MKTKLTGFALIAAMLAGLSGCGLIPYKQYANHAAPAQTDTMTYGQASFALRDARYVQSGPSRVDCSPKRYRDVLVMLALSGGGSRASLLSALSMYQMQNIKVGDSNLLAEVDLISAVSGGALAAAYYAISGDPPDAGIPAACHHARNGRTWDKATVTALMTRDYRDRGLLNWLSPGNFLLYWFTTYNRSDIMADTLDSNLYTAATSGKSLSFADMNPGRPNLVLNATLASEDPAGEYAFGQPFTFTDEDFARIGSSVEDYPISRAVMASSAFPGYFNFMTLRNYRVAKGNDEYVHVFDGANADNLGLTSIKREIWMLHRSGKLGRYRRIVVILVDAYPGRSGVSTATPDVRRWYDYVIDTNIVTATDALLAKSRVELLNQFETADIFPYGHTEWEAGPDAGKRQIRARQASIACERFFSWEPPEEAKRDCENTDWDALNREVGTRLLFAYIGFQEVADPDLRYQLQTIKTDFTLSDATDPRTRLTPAQAIECAVPALVGTEDVTTCGKYQMAPALSRRWKYLLSEIEGPPQLACNKDKRGDGRANDAPPSAQDCQTSALRPQ